MLLSESSQRQGNPHSHYGVRVFYVPGPNHSVAAREELRLLQSALDRLPPQCREAVVMRKIDGLSRKEIAARMGIAEITVRRHRELKAR